MSSKELAEVINRAITAAPEKNKAEVADALQQYAKEFPTSFKELARSSKSSRFAAEFFAELEEVVDARIGL